MSTNTPMSNIPPLGPPTGMPPGGGPSKFKPIDPMRVLRAKWLLLTTALIFGLMVGGGVWYALDKYAAKFSSEAQFNVQATDFSIDNAGASVASPVRMAELEPWINREVQAMKAEPTLREILNKQAVQQTDWFQQFNNNFDDAYTALDEEVIRVRPIREAPLFVVEATTDNEEDARAILRALTDEYTRLNEIKVGIDSRQALDAAQSRRDKAVDNITAIEVKISDFLRVTPLDSISGNSTEAELRVRQLIVEQERLNQALNSFQAVYDQLLARQQAGDFEPSDEERAQIEATNEIFAIDSQMRALRVERLKLEDKFKDDYPGIRAIDLELLALEREREIEYDNQARITFNFRLEQAANNRERLLQETQKTASALTEWNNKRRDYVRLLQEYETLKREQEQAERERDDANSEIAKLNQFDDNNGRAIVDMSVPPQKAKKSFPPSPFVMIPGIGVLLMGLVTGLVFLRELVDQRVRSAQDVKMVPDATLVGMIPNASQDRDTKRVERVVELQPSGLLAEAFRQTRTAVLSKIDRRGYKTLMMVSAKPGAGVTTAAQNLAASCARSGRRVLLIDANFRRPGLAKLMSLPGQPGLAEALISARPIDQFVQQSDVENLSLLPAGDTTNAAVELFESQHFRDLLAKLEAEYDLLIIDAPPCFLTSDAQLLSRHVDAMVLVSRAQTDTRGMLQRLYRELDGQRADILGVLLNGVEASTGGYLKQNFREFREYSGPERRKAKRARTTHTNGSPAPQAADPIFAEQSDDEPDVFGDLDLDEPEQNDR